MKKQLTVAFGLAVLATPAFATKARLEALGEDNYGSYYINDNRNIFLNPARISDNKDLVTYEFGASGDGGAAAAETPASPKAEGGFTKSHGNLVYGLHFGNTSPQVGTIRNLGGAGGNLSERQPWDLFVGGDAGMKWGANVTWESYDSGRQGDTARVASNSLRTRLGVVMGDIDVFTHISLKNDAKDFQGRKIEGDVGYLLGASYMWNNYRLFAEYRHIGAEYLNPVTNTTAGTEDDLKYNMIRIGAGRQERLNDKATMFAKLMIVRENADDDGGATGAALAQGNDFTGAGEATTYQLPLNVGLEYAAASWLDLRASVVQNVWSQLEADPKTGKTSKGHLANTAVRAGASLKFGEFSVDGLISTNDNGDGTIESADASTDGGKGAIRADQLMTRVSMIYRF